MSRTDAAPTTTEAVQVTDVVPFKALGPDVLVVGPTLGGKDPIAFDLLAERWAAAHPPFVITATDTAAQLRSRIDPFVPRSGCAGDLYAIDCTGSSGFDDSADVPTCVSTTPADLTGIGICLAKGYDRFGSPGGRVVLLDNLSTLLVYSDVDRIYRFVSTLNNRVTELGDTTVQLLDTDAVDTTDRHKLFQLFSTLIEVRDRDDTTVFRLRGRAETDWHEYLPRREGTR